MSGPTIISSVIAPAQPLFQGGGAFDLIDLTTLKLLLNITTATVDGFLTSDARDTFLKTSIAQASGAIRRYCNRTFQAQFYQDLFFAERGAYPWQVPGKFMPLQLERWPLTGSASLAGTQPPASPPTLSAAAGGALQATQYFARATYVTATGETAASLESTLLVAANNLLQVALPSADQLGLATGWNVYVGTASGQEIRQNAAPLGIGTAWSEPSTGLVTGASGSNLALPQYILALENVPNVNLATPGTNGVPTSLAEGVDFIADRPRGQLTRFFLDGYPRAWPALPIVVQYWAGYTAQTLATDAPELQDACARLVKAAYYAVARDPKLRSENVAGAYEAQYWFANGPGAEGNFPPDVQMLIDDHRVPVLA